jgi:histidinol-phosphate aminotransferase
MPSSRIAIIPENLIRPEVLALHAYHVPPASGMIKLDAMENPYLLPQALRDEIARLVADAEINRYPDAGAHQLKAAISRVTNLPSGMEVLLGNGSDEIIQLLALAVARPGAVLLSVEPSFVMYKMIAAFVGMKYVGVPTPTTPRATFSTQQLSNRSFRRPRGWSWWTKPITLLPVTVLFLIWRTTTTCW